MAQAEISPHPFEPDNKPKINGEMPPTPPLPDSKKPKQEYLPPNPPSIDETGKWSSEHNLDIVDPTVILDEKLADLYESKGEIDPDKFALQVKAIEAQKILEKAKQSKKPQEISAEQLRILTDIVINADRKSENRLKNLAELSDNLYIPEKKQAIKSETIKALMEKVAKNDGALEVISPDQYDNLIQDISAATDNPDDFIENIEKLDKLVHVVDLEDADKTKVEERLAKQAEDTIVKSMMSKEKIKVTREQAEAVKRKWFTKYGKTDLKRYNERVMDLYQYTDVEGVPKPPPLPKENRASASSTEPDTISLDNDDELVEITEKEAQELSKENSDITELNTSDSEEITDEEADKIVKTKKKWRPDYSKGERWQTEDESKKLKKKIRQMSDLQMEKYRQEGLAMAKEYAKIFTLGELEDRIKRGGIVEYKANVGPDGKKMRKNTLYSLKKAVKFRKRNLKHKTWKTISAEITNNEKINFSVEDFDRSGDEFYQQIDAFKKKHGIHPDNLGLITRLRIEKGLTFSKKEEEMKADLANYAKARTEYLNKVGAIISTIDLSDNKFRSYNELLEAGAKI